MKCPKCQTENPDSRKFCRRCGTKLVLICPGCSSENLPGDEFCGECGQKLAQPLDPSRPSSYTPKHLAEQILTSRSALEGERKLVTVLFADVANLGEARSRGGPPRLWP
jgi:predicted amidophosphoribosyltransferase